MAKITKIGDKNKSSRLSVYLDDEFVCFLNSFTIYKYKLKEGTEIELEKLKQIQCESEKDTAFDLAIKYLSKYQKTESELKDYLQKKGFLLELCDEVVEKVKEYKYVDDKRYVDSFVKNAKGRYGINKIKLSLKQKGIKDELISSIFVEEDLSDLQKLAQKYLKNKEKTSENLQKCAKFMFSRGYCYDDITKVLNELKRGDYENWQWFGWS